MGFLSKFISTEDRDEGIPVEDAVELDSSDTGGQGEPLDQIPGDEDNKPAEGDAEVEETDASDDTSSDDVGGDNPSTDLDEGSEGDVTESTDDDASSDDDSDSDDSSDDQSEDNESGDESDDTEDDSEDEELDVDDGSDDNDDVELTDDEAKETDEALESIRALVLKDARQGGLSIESIAPLEMSLTNVLAKVGLEKYKIVPSTEKFLTPSSRVVSTNVILSGIEQLQRKIRK